MLAPNFYLACLSAKQLSKECHPDPPTSQHYKPHSPSHPTPNPSANPCILQFRLVVVVVVSVLVELCDVGGKSDGGGGSNVECCSSREGDGLKVIFVRFTIQTQQKKKDKATLRNCAFVQHSEYKPLHRANSKLCSLCSFIRWGIMITFKFLIPDKFYLGGWGLFAWVKVSQGWQWCRFSHFWYRVIYYYKILLQIMYRYQLYYICQG